MPLRESPFTAYPGVEAVLARQVREAALDHEAFELPLRVCELSRCRATCCHDGAVLDAEELEGIGGALARHRGRLDAYGWHHPEPVVREPGRGRTATVPAADHELAEDFPSHFPRTRCVFLDGAHRCVLQRLAIDAGRHPWWWKPVSCWMHPLLLRPPADAGRPLLTLARPGRDPASGEGYPGFGSCTPCGVARPAGPPAWQTLRGELELLGRIGRRDLLGELGGSST